MKRIAALMALAALAGCSQQANRNVAEPAAAPAATAQPAIPDLPAGSYSLDKSHSSLLFRVDHLGFSRYTGRFSTFDAKLQLDPANPATASLEVTVDPKSLAVENPPAGFLDTLRGPEWLDGGQFPAITFKSTKVTPTGADTADVAGDFTLHGVTKPLVLKVKFNGGYKGHPMDPNARIGFSATGQLKRSDFGIAYGVPGPGSKMGVSDEVDIAIETEFTGPPLKP